MMPGGATQPSLSEGQLTPGQQRCVPGPSCRTATTCTTEWQGLTSASSAQGEAGLKLGHIWTGGKTREQAPAAQPPVAQSAAAPDDALQLAHLAAIVESSDDAIVSKTLDGRILSWNAGATRIFGYTSEEAIGRPITLIIPEDLRDEERVILQRVAAGERVDHFDTVRVTRDGRRIPISLSVSPIRNADGVIVGASKIARDISERARAEQALRDSEMRLSAEATALTRLTAASTRLWQSETLEGGLEEMLSAVLELLGADKGNVQLLQADGETLVIVAQRGFEQEYLDRFRAVSSTDGSACGRALRSGARAIIEDVEGTRTMPRLSMPPARRATARSSPRR